MQHSGRSSPEPLVTSVRGDVPTYPHLRYLEAMRRRWQDPAEQFATELEGLDHDDPEVRAFAAHLQRMHCTYSRATVEDMLRGVDEFADHANRAQGHRRVVAVLVVGLILLAVAVTVWNALVYMAQTFL